MDYQEIMDIEVGEQLDKEVTAAVFGQPLELLEFKPSTDIADSFKLVNKLVNDGWCLDLIIGSDGYTLASFFSGTDESPTAIEKNQLVCDSPEEAVCRAALMITSEAKYGN